MTAKSDHGLFYLGAQYAKKKTNGQQTNRLYVFIIRNLK